jgi:hypothetical protein
MRIIDCKRKFAVFSYNINHGLLLIRSGKTPAHRTRIDILFQDVWAIECRTEFEDLRIEEVAPDFLNSVRSKAAAVLEPGHKVYALKSSDWVGFVVGGIVSHHEDEGEFFAPSYLLSST